MHHRESTPTVDKVPSVPVPSEVNVPVPVPQGTAEVEPTSLRVLTEEPWFAPRLQGEIVKKVMLVSQKTIRLPDRTQV